MKDQSKCTHEGTEGYKGGISVNRCKECGASLLFKEGELSGVILGEMGGIEHRFKLWVALRELQGNPVEEAEAEKWLEDAIANAAPSEEEGKNEA